MSMILVDVLDTDQLDNYLDSKISKTRVTVGKKNHNNVVIELYHPADTRSPSLVILSPDMAKDLLNQLKEVIQC